MVVKLYISLVSASNEIKKKQQRAMMIMDSLEIPYEVVDVTEPGHDREKRQMQELCKKRNGATVALPPQFFNDDMYCGDYDDFDSANDEDKVKVILKLEEDTPNDDNIFDTVSSANSSSAVTQEIAQDS